MYTIGFYNEKVDNPENLQGCKVIFSEFEKLKKHLRTGDTIKLSSTFSLFEADIKEVLSLEKEYDLNFILSEDISDRQSTNTLTIHFILAINDYIKQEKDIVLKLLT